MDPTEHDAVARPMPQAWLDPHVVDATRLDRLLADRDLVQRLHAADYTGRDWDYVAAELIKYGYAVLIAWMRNGVIRRRLADKNINGLPTPPPWEWHDETWNDLAGATLVIAVEKFRDTVLATGHWKPDGGASLKTFFIGQCLFRFPNPYRSWHPPSPPASGKHPTTSRVGSRPTRPPGAPSTTSSSVRTSLAGSPISTIAPAKPCCCSIRATTRPRSPPHGHHPQGRRDDRAAPPRATRPITPTPDARTTPWRSILNGSRSSWSGPPSVIPTFDAPARASPTPPPARYYIASRPRTPRRAPTAPAHERPAPTSFVVARDGQLLSTYACSSGVQPGLPLPTGRRTAMSRSRSSSSGHARSAITGRYVTEVSGIASGGRESAGRLAGTASESVSSSAV